MKTIASKMARKIQHCISETRRTRRKVGERPAVNLVEARKKNVSGR